MTELYISTRSGNVFEIAKRFNGNVKLNNIGHIDPYAADFIQRDGIPMTVSEEWLASSAKFGFMEPACRFGGQVISEAEAIDIEIHRSER